MFFVKFLGGCEYIHFFDNRLKNLVSNLLVQYQGGYPWVNLQI